MLRKLPNIWYDVSSVCETDAIDALLSNVAPNRVMYGSDDVPVGVLRGKYVSFGYAWAYLSEANHAMSLAHCDGRMTFTRYEQLRAMRRCLASAWANSATNSGAVLRHRRRSRRRRAPQSLKPSGA
ncbi:MAG: hypothetical protein QM775_04645 [Pirellulales bacterium]